MYLICYGTRPELLKLIPLIYKFKQNNIKHIILFSGQHEDLIKEYSHYIKTDIILENIMEKGQSLNELVSKILIKMDSIYNLYDITNVIIQGDTSSAYSIALSSFHKKYHLKITADHAY